MNFALALSAAADPTAELKVEPDDLILVISDLEGGTGEYMTVIRLDPDEPAITPPDEPGETFTDPLASGGVEPQMVVIPAGNFRVGCLSKGSHCSEDEFPVHTVRVSHFALSKYEVTFAEWDACVVAAAEGVGSTLAARGTVSAQHEQRCLGCLVEHAEQRLGRTGGAAFSLFPVKDRVLWHVDAPGELVLGESQALSDTPGEMCHVPHRFGLVLALLCGDVPFGRCVQYFVIDSSCGQVSPLAGINSAARSCHTP